MFWVMILLIRILLGLVLCVIALLFVQQAFATPLALGTPAPTPTANDQDGNPVKFADVYAKGITLVYFYPKSDTPGCTAEACSLRDSYANLKAKGLQIIGVSRDGVDSQKKFVSKYSLPFTIVADPDGSVAKAFAVPSVVVSMRQSFIIKDGKIAWESLSAKTAGAADEIQKALDSLK